MRTTSLIVLGATFVIGCSSGSNAGAPRTGGAGTSGSTGSGGSGGNGTTGSGGMGAPGSCGVTEAEPNDTRDKATPYTAGAAVIGCVGSDGDVDFYQFTAPEADLAGGYYAVGLDDVGDGYADLKIYAASDNGEIDHEYSTSSGASVHAFFAAAPGQQYRIAVSSFSSSNDPFKYTLTAKYTKVTDAFEPNDTKATATPITVGTPITATLFSGYRSSMLTSDEYKDFYKVTLAAGTVTVKASDTPTDTDPEIYLLDADGTEVEHAYTTTMGANVTVMMKAVTAGSYFIQVGLFGGSLDSAGKGIMLPDHFTHPYTLTVQQP